MVGNKTREFGDQLLSSLIVLDFCLWYSVKSLFSSGTTFLNVSSSCDESRNEFARAESHDREESPRAKESRLSTFRGASRGSDVTFWCRLYSSVSTSSDHFDQAIGGHGFVHHDGLHCALFSMSSCKESFLVCLSGSQL